MQVHRAKKEFQKTGVQPVIVGHSSVKWAKVFVKDTGVDYPVYVDETRDVYRALEFKRPLLGFLKLRVFQRAAEARANGFSQPGVHGDAFQVGGVALLKPDGTMPYFYASAESGDHPPIADLLAACEKQ